MKQIIEVSRAEFIFVVEKPLLQSRLKRPYPLGFQSWVREVKRICGNSVERFFQSRLLESCGIREPEASPGKRLIPANRLQRQRNPGNPGVAEGAVVHKPSAHNHSQPAQNQLLLRVRVVVEPLIMVLRTILEIPHKPVLVLDPVPKCCVRPAALRVVPLVLKSGTIDVANFVRAEWSLGAPSLTRYNGYPAVEITGANAPGKSSGQAMQAMSRIVTTDLPRGFGNDWAGQSLQEILSGEQAPMLFALSILIVYLCLAALYESWSIPAAVLMAVPAGLVGATAAAHLRGLPNDVFFKVGPDHHHRPHRQERDPDRGVRGRGAALGQEPAPGGARGGAPALPSHSHDLLRLHPRGVSDDDFLRRGADARHAIGTGVVGGMLSAAVLGVLLIPVCYVAVRRLLGDPLDGPDTRHPGRARGPLAHGLKGAAPRRALLMTPRARGGGGRWC